MAKYKIRPPFSVHLVQVSKSEDGKTMHRNEISHFPGSGEVELTEDDARAHMHKLEPADDAAKQLFEGINAAKQREREARAPGKAPDGLVDAVVAKLKAEGLVMKAPAAAKS